MKNNDIYFQIGENIIHATKDYVAINGAIFQGACVHTAHDDKLVIQFKGRMI